MTNKEAIEILKLYCDNKTERTMPKWGMLEAKLPLAFAMAIKALERQNGGVNGNIWTCPHCRWTFTFHSCPHCNAEMEVEHE